MFKASYVSLIKWITVGMVMSVGCAAPDLEATSTSTSDLSYDCPLNPTPLAGGSDGSDWITGIAPVQRVHDSDVYWWSNVGMSGQTPLQTKVWLHCQFSCARFGSCDGSTSACPPPPNTTQPKSLTCLGPHCPIQVPDSVEVFQMTLAAAQMYDLLAPIDTCRANQYLEFLRLVGSEVLAWRDDKFAGQHGDFSRGNRLMNSWGVFDDDQSNGQWIDHIIESERLSYPMAAFAKRVSANPTAFQSWYRDDAIRFTTAVMETYASFQPEIRDHLVYPWSYHIRGPGLLTDDAGSPEGWNQDIGFSEMLAEAAAAADSSLYRNSSEPNKAVAIQLLTIEAPRFIARNTRFFTDHLEANKYTLSGGSIYYKWYKQYASSNNDLENTGHGQVEVGALAAIYENRAALDAMLQRAGSSERVSASIPLVVLQRLATTFTQFLWRSGDLICGDLYCNTVSLQDNGNHDVKGFTLLSPYDPLVWPRAHDAMFNRNLTNLDSEGHPDSYSRFPGTLTEQGWTALLRYEPGSTNIGKTPREVIAVGETYGCMVASGGKLYCWGDNSSGQLGIGNTVAHSTPVLVMSSGVVSVSVSKGGATTCAIVSQVSPRGTALYCWGDNSYQQLGFRSTKVRELSPVRLDTLGVWPSEDTVNIAVGSRHICETVQSGALWCAGDNTYGQLGNGVFGGATTPQKVTIAADLLNVSAAYYTTCAGNSFASWCWGYNANGQVGNGTVNNANTPQPLPSGMWAVRTGGNHTCGINTNDRGRIFCWGYNYHGELGDQTTTQRLVPVGVAPVATGTGFLTVSSTGMYPRVDVGDYHTCAYGQAGDASLDALYCWGWGYSGQMGQGGTQTSCGFPDTACDQHTPAKLNMGPLPYPADFAVGGNSTFGGWGNGPQPFGLNSTSQLGIGNTANQYTVWPFTIGGLTF